MPRDSRTVWLIWPMSAVASRGTRGSCQRPSSASNRTRGSDGCGMMTEILYCHLLDESLICTPAVRGDGRPGTAYITQPPPHCITRGQAVCVLSLVRKNGLLDVNR